jgi:hypothetical protein
MEIANRRCSVFGGYLEIAMGRLKCCGYICVEVGSRSKFVNKSATERSRFGKSKGNYTSSKEYKIRWDDLGQLAGLNLLTEQVSSYKAAMQGNNPLTNPVHV